MTPAGSSQECAQLLALAYSLQVEKNYSQSIENYLLALTKLKSLRPPSAIIKWTQESQSEDGDQEDMRLHRKIRFSALSHHCEAYLKTNLFEKASTDATSTIEVAKPLKIASHK